MIRKLQTGGLAQFFALYTPPSTSRQPVQRQSASSSKKEDNTDALEKEYYNMLMKDLRGLPNEAKFMASRLVADMQLDALKGISDPMSIQIKMAQAISQISQMKFNQEEYNKAYNRAVANSSLNDYAITVDGKVLVQNKNGEIERVSSEEFAKLRGSGDYFPITNSNILWLRANSPQYSFNNTILQTVENGINLDKVHDMIKDRMYDIGKQTTSINHIYQKGVQAKGLELLEQMTALGPEGYYEYKKKLTTADQSAINSALEYIYKTLPANAKARLRLETKNGTDKEAYELIGNMLMSRIDTSSENEIKYMGTDEKVTGNKSKESKDGSDSEPYEGFWRQVQSGKGGTDDTYNVLIGKTYLSVDGKYYGTTPGMDSNTSLTKYIGTSGIGHLIKNKSNITFGDSQISINSFDDIMVNAAGGAMTATLPIKPDGKVNFEVLKIYSNIVDNLKESGIQKGTQEYEKKKGEMLKKEGLGYLVDSNGYPDRRHFGHFLIIEGVATSKANRVVGNREEPIELTQFMKDKSNDDALYDSVRVALSTKDNKYELDNNWADFLWTSNDKLYAGNIYIPINTNPLSAFNADENKVKESRAQDYEEMQQVWNKQEIANQDNDASKI